MIKTICMAIANSLVSAVFVLILITALKAAGIDVIEEILLWIRSVLANFGKLLTTI